MTAGATPHACPVCGYDGLYAPPWDADAGPSHEICPCCGIHFGYDDGSSDDRGPVYARWRADWQRAGRPWFSRGRPAPAGWDAQTQLHRAGLADA